MGIQLLQSFRIQCDFCYTGRFEPKKCKNLIHEQTLAVLSAAMSSKVMLLFVTMMSLAIMSA